MPHETILNLTSTTSLNNGLLINSSLTSYPLTPALGTIAPHPLTISSSSFALAYSSESNLKKLATQLSASLQHLSGSLFFDQGVVVGDLVTPLGTLQGTVDFAQRAGDFMGDFLEHLTGTLDFSDGRVAIDFPSVFGTIAGTIEFGRGVLVTSLTTPLGDLDFAVPFRETDKIQFTVRGYPAVLDFSKELAVVDLMPNTLGGEIAIALKDLSGTISFSAGQAAIEIPSIFGTLSMVLDLSQLADDLVTDALKGSGTVIFEAGIATIDVTGPLGTIRQTVDFPAIAQSLLPIFCQTQSIPGLTDGVVANSLLSLESLLDWLDLSALVGDEPLG
ncbi:MAG: hypothetical protein HC780_00465 [Leptolyngbyaceae cyanobacterium CSU_1_3]|nr:hypothetical protein [Leptolyngbyaceae cyanobacterium CSU_1_3]